MKPQIINPEIHEKKWGTEFWLINKEFCGKVLEFNKAGNKFSCHLHRYKDEIFYFLGKFKFIYIDTDTAEKYEIEVKSGDSIYIPQCVPHQLIALEDNAKLIEISSHHEDSDSYRIAPGDSQT